MTPRQQEIYEALYVERTTYENVSMRLGITIGAVKFHAFRIRTKCAAAGHTLPDNRTAFFLHRNVNENSVGINPN